MPVADAEYQKVATSDMLKHKYMGAGLVLAACQS